MENFKEENFPKTFTASYQNLENLVPLVQTRPRLKNYSSKLGLDINSQHNLQSELRLKIEFQEARDQHHMSHVFKNAPKSGGKSQKNDKKSITY